MLLPLVNMLYKFYSYTCLVLFDMDFIPSTLTYMIWLLLFFSSFFFLTVKFPYQHLICLSQLTHIKPVTQSELCDHQNHLSPLSHCDRNSSCYETKFGSVMQTKPTNPNHPFNLLPQTEMLIGQQTFSL